MSKPSVDDFYIAAQWLDVYEGAEDQEACQRVAEWLKKHADAIEFKAACKDAGVSVRDAKKAIKSAA